MKSFFVLLFAAILFFGIVGCPASDNPSTVGSKSSFTSSSVATSDTNSTPTPMGNDISPVPEPATLMLLGSGLVGLAGLGRKRFKK